MADGGHYQRQEVNHDAEDNHTPPQTLSDFRLVDVVPYTGTGRYGRLIDMSGGSTIYLEPVSGSIADKVFPEIDNAVDSNLVFLVITRIKGGDGSVKLPSIVPQVRYSGVYIMHISLASANASDMEGAEYIVYAAYIE